MQPTPPLQELAARLRYLRLEYWANSKLTQGGLGEALGKAAGEDQGLSAATVASWESKTAPKLPPRERLLAYAQFFATRRSVDSAPRLLPVDSFTAEEQSAYDSLRDDLLRLHTAARGGPEQLVAQRSWHFSDTGPVTLVCAQLPDEEAGPLADPANPNHTELHSYADADAILELWGHIRMENPPMEVAYKFGARVAADDLSGHVVIIGGIAWNDVTQRILDLAQLPIKQQVDPAIETGEIFVTEIDGKEHRYLPKWSEATPAKLTEDVGLLVRMPNPLNSNRTLTMCNGIHSRGVLGAARSLTDKRLRESNERYIAKNFTDNQKFCILMRIQVIEGVAMTPDFSIAGTVLYQWPAASGQASFGSDAARARR